MDPPRSKEKRPGAGTLLAAAKLEAGEASYLDPTSRRTGFGRTTARQHAICETPHAEPNVVHHGGEISFSLGMHVVLDQVPDDPGPLGVSDTRRGVLYSVSGSRLAASCDRLVRVTGAAS